MVTRSFTLPKNILDDRPTKLLSELRRGVAILRKTMDVPTGSEILDIGFKRDKDTLEVTLYFAPQGHPMGPG